MDKCVTRCEKKAPPNRVFAGKCPRYPAAAAGHKPKDTPVATGKAAVKKRQKVTRKDIAVRKKASQELAAAQRTAAAPSPQPRPRKKKACTDTQHHDGDESSDVSSTPSLRAEDEHPPSTPTPGPHDINIVEPGQLAAHGYQPMDSGDESAHSVDTDEEFAARWDDRGEGEDPDDMTDDIKTGESPVDVAGSTPRTRLSSPPSAANNWRKLTQEEMVAFARDADAVRAMRDDGWELGKYMLY
ncbi:hypothetical protein JG687_00001268 [Phytophthora cactorum]|uniref:Uncharacterized protein n=1 Tax=Phytophthora cactorum TaxID=29920 RepID=A0A8T1V2G3_9STRA|nr:hypothetical protein JG687_00001268 [Phytophthora cactorum]